MNLLKLLFFMESRKVGFGLWLFMVANAFLMKHFIDSDRWFLCVTLSTGLLGGGTIADKYLENQKNKPETPKA